ncbi:hypothetical protein NDU88_005468 [Pleurodeles waltl]|uniref:Uncharacterized protein n=1 Tax=Pleurodeles waltl TaxID=8319 RepID=A0AAV7MXL1_PLEWA|nr:hypothetical protein NDU88_005468 [Pleurodeles waltl]
MKGQCDEPIGVSPHTTLTCAAAAPDAREPHDAGFNRTPQLVVTLRPGSSNAGPKEEEKAAFPGGERCIKEKEESSFVGVQPCVSGEEEETAARGTKSVVAPGGGARKPTTLLEKRGKTRRSAPRGKASAIKLPAGQQREKKEPYEEEL